MSNNLCCSVTNTESFLEPSYRSPANPHGRSDAQQESRGFLDGDFLEMYLAFEPGAPELKKIREGSNEAERLRMSHSEIRSILERLQSTR